MDKNQKGSLIIIVGIVILALLTSSGIYYYVAKQKNLPLPLASNSPFPTASVNHTPAESIQASSTPKTSAAVPSASVNPTPNLKTYQNTNYNFSFKYSSNFTLTTWNSNSGDDHTNLTQPSVGIVSVSIPQSLYPKTNLALAQFSVSTSNTIQSEDACLTYDNGVSQAKMQDTQTINGTKFYKTRTTGAAAGTFYEERFYHVFKDNKCYELNTTVGTSTVANYDPKLGIKEVDTNSVWTNLETIVNTFKFTK